MSVIKVENLSKTYFFYRKEPGFLGSLKSFFYRKSLAIKAVKNVNFSLEQGELIGFLGPNGAGKTTTLKMLSGIIYPTGGSIEVLGHTPSKREKVFQRQFALVTGQKNQLIRDLPAVETFVLNREIYEIPDDEFHRSLEELKKLLQIEDFMDIPVRKLSLGQRMKCELVAALLHRPRVLLLDEPTIGLDVVAQKNIRDFIKRYNRDYKTTVILTSHYMEDIKELCDRVLIINLGEIIYDGKLDELIRKHAPYKVLKITFNEEVVREDLARFGEIEKFDRYSASIRTTREEIKKAAIAILSSSLPVDDILIDEVDIDDIVRKIFMG